MEGEGEVMAEVAMPSVQLLQAYLAPWPIPTSTQSQGGWRRMGWEQGQGMVVGCWQTLTQQAKLQDIHVHSGSGGACADASRLMNIAKQADSRRDIATMSMRSTFKT